VFTERVREACATLYIALALSDYILKHIVLQLVFQDIQRADDCYSGVYHSRELPAEDHQGVEFDFLRLADGGFFGDALVALQVGDVQPLLVQPCNDKLLVFGFDFAFDVSANRVNRRVFEVSHD
jgi:hypothetical protein